MQEELTLGQVLVKFGCVETVVVLRLEVSDDRTCRGG